MTLTALEQKCLEFNKRLLEWEAAGLRGCAMMHECRELLQMTMKMHSQVQRAIVLTKEGNTKEALVELGDYTTQ